MVTAYVPIKNRLDSLLSLASGGPDHGREAITTTSSLVEGRCRSSNCSCRRKA
jgi:hypothetical protein